MSVQSSARASAREGPVTGEDGPGALSSVRSRLTWQPMQPCPPLPGADADLVRVVEEVEIVGAKPITAEDNFRVALNCTDLEPIT